MIPLIALVVFSFILYKLVYWLTHRRPLNDKEIKDLSSARKKIYINKTYRFTRSIINVNEKYRASLNANGRWDKVSIPFEETLSLLSQLLRYKRHEWFVWCLCRDGMCERIWANKGDDNESCYSKIETNLVVANAVDEGYSTIICMHNHPHTKDRYWNLLQPSEKDLNSLEKRKELCRDRSVNYINALCSQGNFIIYGYIFCEKQMPHNVTEDGVREENGKSEKQNYKLHRELKKNKKVKVSL